MTDEMKDFVINSGYFLKKVSPLNCTYGGFHLKKGIPTITFENLDNMLKPPEVGFHLKEGETPHYQP